MNALTKIENTAIAAMSEQELITVLQSSLYPGAKQELANGAKVDVLGYAAWLELQEVLAEDRSYFAERSARPEYRSERGELNARARFRDACLAEVSARGGL